MPLKQLFCACCSYRCNTHAYDLELVKTMKISSDNQVNSVILQTRFHMPGKGFFLSQKHTLKRASRNMYMESQSYSVSTLMYTG